MRRGLAIAAACWVALGVLGCGNGDNPVLAKVGKTRIRLEDYAEHYRRISPEFRPDLRTPEARRGFLQNIVFKEIMLQEAEARGIGEDRFFQLRAQDRYKEILTPVFIEDLLKDRPEPPEDALAELEEELRHTYHLRMMVLESREEAEEVRGELDSGRPFAEVARERLEGPGAERGGDIGKIRMDTMLPEFRGSITALAPGERTTVLEFQGLFHFFYLEEKEEIEGLIPENLRKLASDVWEREWNRRAVFALLAELKEEWDYQVNEELLEDVARRFEEATPEGEQPGRNLEQWPVFTETEKETEVASWRGERLTLDDFLYRVENMPERVRPPLGNRPSLMRTLEQMVTDMFLMQEARRRGLDEREDVAWDLRKAWERRRLRAVRGQVVAGVEADEEDIRSYYEENQDKFTGPEEYLVRAIVASDSAQAESLFHVALGGEDFADLARKNSIHQESRRRGGRLGWVGPDEYEDLHQRLLSAYPGRPMPAVRALDGFTVVRVDSTRGTRPLSLEEVRQRIEAALMPDVQDRALSAWLDERVAEVAEVFPERLEEATLPPDVLSGGAAAEAEVTPEEGGPGE